VVKINSIVFSSGDNFFLKNTTQRDIALPVLVDIWFPSIMKETKDSVFHENNKVQ